MDGYSLSRQLFDWSYENPDRVNPNHIALYFFIIEHNNRLGWKEKFGLPMQMSMDAIGIKNYKTWSKTFNDLIEWGFVAVYQRSKNQYSANVIGLVKNTKAKSKAMDKAMLKHSQKQVHGIVGIDKPITIEPINKEPIDLDIPFETFWELYDKKEDRKKSEGMWDKLPLLDKKKIIEILPRYKERTPDKKFRKNPTTFFNNRTWEDEETGRTEPAIKFNHTITTDENEW